MRSVLIQCADVVQAPLLDFSHPLHARFADRHGFDFWSVRGHVQRTDHVMWNKVALVMVALLTGVYENIVWLDADALIVNPACDLKAVLPPGKFLGVTVAPERVRRGRYALTGAFYVRGGEEAIRFFEALRASSADWNEEAALNALLTSQPHWRAGVAVLDDCWHAHAGMHDTEGAAVVGWHCQGDTDKRLRLMRARAHREGLI